MIQLTVILPRLSKWITKREVLPQEDSFISSQNSVFTTSKVSFLLHSSVTQLLFFTPNLYTTFCRAIWKYQVSGAGLVSSVSSRALVSLQRCVLHVFAFFCLVFRPNWLLCTKWGGWCSLGIGSLCWDQVVWSWKSHKPDFFFFFLLDVSRKLSFSPVERFTLLLYVTQSFTNKMNFHLTDKSFQVDYIQSVFTILKRGNEEGKTEIAGEYKCDIVLDYFGQYLEDINSFA